MRVKLSLLQMTCTIFNKHNFRIPFLCGFQNLGEALRRIAEGASMIRTKGEVGIGNVIEAVRHVRSVLGDISFRDWIMMNFLPLLNKLLLPMSL